MIRERHGVTTVFVSSLIWTLGCLGAPNLFPDPGFEQTGTPGVARTGRCSGHLKIGKKVHWTCIGGRLEVEPFATYRATGWVKARVGGGNVFALYVYTWNSFDWRFSRSVRLRTTPDWKRVEVAFAVPTDHVYFHPLAAIDAEDSEAWIDDVTLEKIAEPGVAVGRILKKSAWTDEDIEFLARWYVHRNERAKAASLMKKASAYTRADIACLLAKTAPSPAERLRYVVEMVRWGGPTYANGMTRFRELTGSASSADILDVCLRAAEQGGGRGAARVLRESADAWISGKDTARTVAEREAMLRRIRDVVERIRAVAKEEAAVKRELSALDARLGKAAAALAAEKASLGNAQIVLNGAPVTSEGWAIVIPDRPTPQERFAAADLRALLERIMGWALPVLHERERGERHPVAVGKCLDLHRQLGVRVDWERLGIEGIHIESNGPWLVLAGNKRGVLYACYTFLEDYLGCRWFTPDCTVLPRSGRFDLRAIRKVYIPPLEYRATDYPNSRDADWAVRNKLNGPQTRIDEKRGGKIIYRGFVHTFNALVPPSKYFAEHPEYYSMVKGKRIGPERTQLCLTNPDVLRIATETVRRWFRETPEASIVSVSQNDWWNYCQCPKCSALAEKEGSQAGPLIHFVNAIADAIRDEFPDKVIDTLAYQWSRKPPRHVRPRPNVIVRLCSIECCFAHPLESDPYNASFKRDIEGWSKICNRLYIWDYVINYAHCIMPFPNLYVLKPNINFFIRNGVKGIYEEANYFSKGGEFAELRTWIIAKTLWDPTYDTDRAIDEFLEAYYGPAAGPIRRYINLIHDQVRKNPDLHVRIYSPPTAGYLTPEVIRESVRLFDDAERRVKDDPVFLHRVQVARLPLLYTRIVLSGNTYVEADDRLTPVSAADGADVPSLVARFEAIAKAEGVTHIREGQRGYIGPWLERQKQRGRPLDVVRLRTPQLEAVVIPTRGGRIWRLVHRPTGADLLKRYGDSRGGFEVDRGGYEEYSEAGYRSPGWTEPFEVLSRSESAVTLRADLPNGLRMLRRIELSSEKPEVVLRTVLSNPGGGVRTGCVRVHPEFAVSDPGAVEVRVRRGERWSTLRLPVKGLRNGEGERWLNGKDMPAGAWSWFDPKRGVGIVDEFDPAGTAKAYVNWNVKTRRVNLELWSRPKKLRGGARLVFEHRWRVLTR